MGSPKKNRSRSEPVVTRDDLRIWANGNLNHFRLTPSVNQHISYALVEKFDHHALFLIASRNAGADIFAAAKVVFALVRGSRGRIVPIRLTEVVERNHAELVVWRGCIEHALRSIEVDPAFLDKLSPRMGNVRLC